MTSTCITCVSSVRGILRTRTTSKWYKVLDQYCAFDADLTLQHQQKHQPRTMECCSCYKTFKSFSGVLIHLESGGCSSNITEDDIDDLARECYQSRKYINNELEDGGWLYTCPHCDTEFSKLSALYQYAEDVPSCSYLAKDHGCLTKLERFISRNLEQ
jgi:protein-arginine kinase activator protein McsA